MSAMVRHALRAVLLTATLFSLSLSTASPAQGQDVNQHLRNQYQGKTFVLRGFPAGDRLRYDSSGLPENAVPGDWTADGFVRVKDLRSSHHRLIIEAKRLLVIQLDGQEFQFLPEKDAENRELKIETDLDLDKLSLEEADAALSRIFLTAHDDLADLVSDYWRPCIRTAQVGTDSNCRFSPEFLPIPGVAASQGNSSAVTATSTDGLVAGQVRRLGKGASPPRAVYAPNPEFSERARKAKFQGVVMLSLVVNEEGLPAHIRITKPIGYGLDEKALSCVKKWRFKPAEKDGQPVPYEIAVEVQFHLY